MTDGVASADDFLRHNDESRRRLGELVARLEGEALGRVVAEGWTVAAVLAHLAFWDRWVVARWDRYDREGGLGSLPDEVLDLVNAAAAGHWLALPAATAVDLALAAAEEADRRIAALPRAGVEHALATGRPAMLDRSLHRTPHLDEVERALAG